jgi:hypothetical protein
MVVPKTKTKGRHELGHDGACCGVSYAFQHSGWMYVETGVTMSCKTKRRYEMKNGCEMKSGCESQNKRGTGKWVRDRMQLLERK